MTRNVGDIENQSAEHLWSKCKPLSLRVNRHLVQAVTVMDLKTKQNGKNSYINPYA